jgi:tetratricopeptide (TPR) repeat protein
MKLNKYTAVALAAVVLAGCSKIDEIAPQGSTLLDSQVKETNTLIPSRVNASFNGMYTKIAEPNSVFGSDRPDDWGFAMISFSSDAEAADLVLADSDYNWFSVCGELSSRNADYANPYVRYAAPYNEIAAANDVIKSYPADTEDQNAIYQIAQAKAIRAYSYLNLAPYFQFNYASSADKPCVPIVTETTEDFTNNPRATVAQVYELILSDLNYAVEKLEGFARPDKSRIDQKVAYGLRARAYLNMGEWLKAAQDAEKAAEGFTPATMEQISVPSFYQLSEGNWIWGYDMTLDIAKIFPFATSSSWVRSFSGNGYAPATQVYSCINNLLYDKIPATDVRKNWWVNEDLYSPVLDEIAWTYEGVAYSGLELANLEITDVKMAFLPYTNVKFGMNTIGGVDNDEDWPLMRVEEMILIQAEGYAKSGDTGKAKQILENFVKTYRDPSYSVDNTGRNFEDEIWFQRRVELWGEGFSNNDTRRLAKPLVRFHEGKKTNVPDNFCINMTPTDGWWLMRFTTSELNTNLAVVDNSEGTSPVMYQNGDLRDGVTD